MLPEPNHPLLYLLQRIETVAPEIRKWSAYWAKANLIPVLRDIRAAMDCDGLTLADLQRNISPLQFVLKQRDDTALLATLPEGFATQRMAGDGSPPLPNVVPLDKRIPNEIKTAADRVIEILEGKPTSPSAPNPPAGTSEANS